MSNKYMPSDHESLMSSLEQMLVAITIIKDYVDSYEKNASMSESVRNAVAEQDEDDEENDDNIEAIFDEDDDVHTVGKSTSLETLETANLALQSFHLFVESYFDKLDDMICGVNSDDKDGEEEQD